MVEWVPTNCHVIFQIGLIFSPIEIHHCLSVHSPWFQCCVVVTIYPKKITIGILISSAFKWILDSEKSTFNSPFVVQFIKFFCSSRLVIESLHLWFLQHGSRTILQICNPTFSKVFSYWSLNYRKASRWVTASMCTIYPYSYRFLSSMLGSARF